MIIDFDSIVDRIVNATKLEKIVLFGSYAYGKPDKDSDIDLLIIKNTELPFNKRAHEIRKSLRGIGVPIDLIVYTPEEIEKWKDTKHSFIKEVQEKGEVLYEDKETHTCKMEF